MHRSAWLALVLMSCGGSSPPPATVTSAPIAAAEAQSTPRCSEGWCYSNPLPGGSFFSVAVLRPRLGLAVGASGVAALVGPDGFRALDTGTQVDLHGVAVVDEANAWVVGDGGTILHFDGQRFTESESGTEIDLQAVWASAEIAVAVGLEGTILTRRAERWEAESSGTDLPLRSVWASGPDDIIVGGFAWADAIAEAQARHEAEERGEAPEETEERADGEGDVDTGYWDEHVATRGALLHFDGERWVARDPEAGVFDVFGIDTEHTFSVFYESDVNVSGAADEGCSVGGGDVEVLRTHSGDVCTAGWASSSSDLWVVGQNGSHSEAYILHFDGERWVRMGQDLIGDSVDVAGSGPDDVFVVGTDGLVAHFDGESLTTLSGPSASLRSMWMHSERSGFVASSFGRFWHFDGERWRYVEELDHSRAAWWSSPTEAIIVGDEGQAFRWNAGEVTPLPHAPATYLELYRAPFGPLLATTREHDVVAYDGESWTDVDAPGQPRLVRRWEGDGVVFFLGTRGLVRYDASGWTEHPAPEGESLIGLEGTASNDLWITTNSGHLLHWDGESFTVEDTGVNVPLYAVAITPEVTAIAGRGVLLAREGSGAWQVTEMEDTPWSVEVMPDGEIFAAGNMGLRRWDDGQWRSLPAFAHQDFRLHRGPGGTFAMAAHGPVILRYVGQ